MNKIISSTLFFIFVSESFDFFYSVQKTIIKKTDIQQ